MYIGSGDSLGNMLINLKATCLTCGKEITFKSGADYAKSNGINDNVVMCDKCKSVFTVDIGRVGMTFKKNVTSTYFTPQEIAAICEKEKKNLRGCLIFFVVIILFIIALAVGYELFLS